MTIDTQQHKALALQQAGKFAEAAAIYERITQENPLNATAQHYLGLTLMQLGDLTRAQKCLEHSAVLDPTDANTLSDLGAVLARLKNYDLAVNQLTRALTIDGSHGDALNNIAATLNTLHRPYDALPYLQRLNDIRPGSVQTLCKLGHTCLKLGNAESAIVHFRDAVRLEPGRARARILLGEALEAVGKFTQARAQYLSVLRREESNVVALAKLLGLRGAALESTWVDRAQELLERESLSPREKARLHIGLGQYYDRSGAYDLAFGNFDTGCEIQFALAPFDHNSNSAAVDKLISTFTAELFARVARPTVSSPRPIFIVGMPRSGTTLVEQILASHSRVAAGGELSSLMNIGLQVGQLGGRRYPDGLRDVNVDDLTHMAKRYLDGLDRISVSAEHVTDKQPFNFLHLGLAAILFPSATIIHCRRNPLDTCLSCYFVSFSEEFQFASSLRTLGHYYLDYHRLMEHWRSALPTTFLDVQYEELVQDTHRVVDRILNYCGLPWEETCLRFHETERAVRTPSRWQVRQPIYSASVGRWRHYEKHLKPMREILAPVLCDESA